MQSGPGDFLNFTLVQALVSSSYEIGEFITGGTSSDSPMILSCDRVSLCCCVVIFGSCSLIGKYQQISWQRFLNIFK